MKTLVIYYSMTGNCDKAANYLASELSCDVEKLRDKANYKGFFGFVNSAIKAVWRQDTEIESTKYNPQDYEKIVFVSPLWMGKVCPAIRKYIEIHKSNLRSISLIGTSGSTNCASATKDIYKYYEIIVDKKIGIKLEDIENDSYKTILKNFLTA